MAGVSQLGDYVRRVPWVREALRHLLTSCTVHRQGIEPDIVIFACRRSGSTWLMELIASSKNVRFVNEPFLPQLVATVNLPTGLESLPVDMRKVLDVPPDASSTYLRHLRDPGATRVRGPYQMTSPQYHFFTNRRVLKVVHGTAIADWILDQDPGLIPIYLARHPIATALSLARSANALRTEANLRHTNYRQEFLTDRLVQLATDVLRSGSLLEKFVVEWCLDNLSPYRSLKDHSDRWIVVTYEELLLEPSLWLNHLGQRLRLPGLEKAMKRVAVPSASTLPARRAEMLGSKTVAQVTRWSSHVDEATERHLFGLVGEFGIDIYRTGRYVAMDRYLHFASTPRLFRDR